MTNRRVLYVDDREGNLNAFKGLLRRDYEIHISTNPVSALELIGQEDIAVVITDYKMPEMTGVEFLEKVRDQYPHTVRILISGHADIEAVIQSINKGEVFRFIRKPWHEEILISEINQAFELYDAKLDLSQKNDALRQAYEELSFFTYSAAHNLTGPVATIQGLVELFKKEPENQKDLINYIENTALAMRNHLKNIIAFNKNKVEPVDIREINVVELINENLNDFEPYPDFSELKVRVDVKQNEAFVSDAHRLNRIITNLISNVIKYRDVDKDTNELNITGEVNEEGLKLEISDNGIGIKEENLEKISQIFFREPSSELGSGIGMYIVEQTTEKLGGKFELESTKGEFTKYTFHFPSLKE